MQCPVCKSELSLPLPENCPSCGKKNLKYDLTLTPTLHKIPDHVETNYVRWIGFSRRFFQAKKQNFREQNSHSTFYHFYNSFILFFWVVQLSKRKDRRLLFYFIFIISAHFLYYIFFKKIN